MKKIIRLVLVIGFAVIAGCTVTPVKIAKVAPSPFPNRGQLVMVKSLSADAPASVFCAGATGHVLIGAGPTYVDCGTTTPTCTPPAVWNGSACVNPTPNACNATDTSTPFGVVVLTRQCSGSASYAQYHPQYNGQLYEAGTPGTEGIWTDATYKGPFPKYLSGYTMALTVTSKQYVSVHIHAGSSGQMQLTSDPSNGDAGILSISTVQGAFSGPSILTGTYGPCIYNYGAANSMWIGTGGTDCPMVVGGDYWINFADVTADGTPGCFNQPGVTNCPTSKVSYQIVSSH